MLNYLGNGEVVRPIVIYFHILLRKSAECFNSSFSKFATISSLVILSPHQSISPFVKTTVIYTNNFGLEFASKS